MVMNNDSQIYYTHFEITGGLCNLIGSNWCDLFTNRTIATFVSKTLTFSPQKMDEFSDRLSQVLHQQNIWTDQVLHLRISKWM